MNVYVHLIPQTTSLISETIKFSSVSEDSLVNDLRLKVVEQLNKQNDGNKIY